MRISSDIRFLGATGFVVALLGVQTLASLAPEEIPGRPLAPQHESVEPRAPASVSPEVEVPVSALAKLKEDSVLDVDCKKEELSAQVQGGQLRFRGRSCFRGERLDRLEISNLTNGTSVIIMRRGTSEYETDLMPLSAGDNQVRIARIDDSGRRIERIFKVHSVPNQSK